MLQPFLWFAEQTTAPTGAATTILANAPTSLTGNPGQPAGQPPSVLVTDGSGNGVSGVTVTFAVTAGGGSVTGASQVTNTHGIATVPVWTFGATGGTNLLTATSAGLVGSPVTFTAQTYTPVLPTRRGGFRLRFRQTDTASVVTGPLNTGRQANTGGTIDRLCADTLSNPVAGSTITPVTLDANARDVYAVSFDLPVPDYALWVSGTYTVRLRVHLPNPMVHWNRTYLVRVDSQGNPQAMVGFLYPNPQNFATPGVKEVRVYGEGQPTRNPGDRLVVVCCFSNMGTVPPYNLRVGSTSPQPCSLMLDQALDTPIVV